MNIKAVRRKARLTQLEFSEAVGVSLSTVQAWEQGVRPITPQMKKLINLLTFSERW